MSPDCYPLIQQAIAQARCHGSGLVGAHRYPWARVEIIAIGPWPILNRGKIGRGIPVE